MVNVMECHAEPRRREGEELRGFQTEATSGEDRDSSTLRFSE